MYVRRSASLTLLLFCLAFVGCEEEVDAPDADGSTGSDADGYRLHEDADGGDDVAEDTAADTAVDSSDTSDTTCSVDGAASTCTAYRVDLRIRMSATRYPVNLFAGEVKLPNRTVSFRCPTGGNRKTTSEYVCNFDDRNGNLEASSLRIFAGTNDRDAIEDVELHVISDFGSFDGTVDLQPYDYRRSGGDGCGPRCRGSAGEALVSPQNPPSNFGDTLVRETCGPAGGSTLEFRAGTASGDGCTIDSDPRIVAEITDNGPSDNTNRALVELGPNRPDGSAKLCTGGSCDAVSGRIVFNKYESQNSVAGHWEFERPDGTLLEGDFSGNECSQGGCL